MAAEYISPQPPGLLLPDKAVYRVHFNNKNTLLVFAPKHAVNAAIAEAAGPDAIYVNDYILPDDTIAEIKGKIQQALGPAAQPQDMYLFATATEAKPAPIADKIGPPEFLQHMANMGHDDPETVFAEDRAANLRGKTALTQADLLNPAVYRPRKRIPLGVRFPAAYADDLPADPARVFWFPPNIGAGADAETVPQPNMTLLEYGELAEPVLHVRFLEDIAHQPQMAEEAHRQIYFPPGTKIPPKFATPENVRALYETAWRQGDGALEAQFRTYGITLLHLEIRSHTDARPIFPLDAIFRNIHSDADIPFIKYSPVSATGGEALLRLYSDGQTDQGRKIPFLPYTKISQLNRENTRHLVLSVANSHREEVFLTLFRNGGIEVRVVPTVPTPRPLLEAHIAEYVNPVLRQFNRFFAESGFAFAEFTGLRESRILAINTTAIVPQIPAGIWNTLSFMQGIMNRISDNLNNAELRFCRITNYSERREIRDILKSEILRGGNQAGVIEEVKRKFPRISAERLREIYTEILQEEQNQRANMFKRREQLNGFPVRFSQEATTNLRIDAEGMTAVQYMDTVHMYVSAFLWMLQRGEIKQEDIEPVVVMFDDAAMDEEMEHASDYATEEADDDEAYAYDDDDAAAAAAAEPVYEGEVDVAADEDDDLLFLDETDGGARKAKTRQNLDFLERLQERDPSIFVKRPNQKKGYATICQSNVGRTPVVLSRAELDNIRKHDAQVGAPSFDEPEPLEYGSDPNNPNYYICPRYWNFRENRSISEKEMAANPAYRAALIVNMQAPLDENIANGKYIYEFKKGKRMEGDRYAPHFAGLTEETTEDGTCFPCCFKSQSESYFAKIQQCKARQGPVADPGSAQPPPSTEAQEPASAPAEKKDYIIDINITPLPTDRWGRIPPALEALFGLEDYGSKIQGGRLVNDEHTLLRHGVEQRPRKQSFLSCFADVYAYVRGIPTPSLAEFKRILREKITLDKFLLYQNSSLSRIFGGRRLGGSPPDLAKYTQTEFYSTIRPTDPTEAEFAMQTIRAYENFVRFLEDPRTTVEHHFLWDAITAPDPDLIPRGLNLVIIDLESNDAAEAGIICPTSCYSDVPLYTPEKNTLLLIRRSEMRENYYEPVYSFLKRANEPYTIRKLMTSSGAGAAGNAMLLPFLTGLAKYDCQPVPSRPAKYAWKVRDTTARAIAQRLRGVAAVVWQVLNQLHQAMGVVVSGVGGGRELYLPCFPSAPIRGIKQVFLTAEVRRRITSPLADVLAGLSAVQRGLGEAFHPAQLAVAAAGDADPPFGLFLKFGGFIPVEAGPALPPAVANMPKTETSDPMQADMEVLLPPDPEMMERMRMFRLDREFYAAFQNLLRELINLPENEATRDTLMQVVSEGAAAAQETAALDRVVEILGSLARGRAIFNEFDPAVLSAIDEVVQCRAAAAAEQPYCVYRAAAGEAPQIKTIFPKWGLIDPKQDNEVSYYERLADALIRNPRLRNVVLLPFKFYNMMGLGGDDYKVRENEILIAASAIREFEDLTPFMQGALTTFEVAQPARFVPTATAAPAAAPPSSPPSSADDQGQMDLTPPTSPGQRISVAPALAAEAAAPMAAEPRTLKLSCLEKTTEVKGNEDWGRNWFPREAREMVFKNLSTDCTYEPFAWLLAQQGLPVMTRGEIQRELWTIYAGLDTTAFAAVVRWRNDHLLLRERLNDVVPDDLRELVLGENYFLMDLDFWALAEKFQIPLVLFNSKSPLQLLDEADSWKIILPPGTSRAEAFRRPFYFLRYPRVVQRYLPSYHMITPALTIPKLRNPAFYEQVAQIGPANWETDPRTCSLDYFLHSDMV